LYVYQGGRIFNPKQFARCHVRIDVYILQCKWTCSVEFFCGCIIISFCFNTGSIVSSNSRTSNRHHSKYLWILLFCLFSKLCGSKRSVCVFCFERLDATQIWYTFTLTVIQTGANKWHQTNYMLWDISGNENYCSNSSRLFVIANRQEFEWLNYHNLYSIHRSYAC